MTKHPVYDKIVEAIKKGALSEPFCCDDIEGICTGVEGYSPDYLEEHKIGNKLGNKELFKEVVPGRFRCATPSDYSAI